jgi:hypothetical protein
MKSRKQPRHENWGEASLCGDSSTAVEDSGTFHSPTNSSDEPFSNAHMSTEAQWKLLDDQVSNRMCHFR